MTEGGVGDERYEVPLRPDPPDAGKSISRAIGRGGPWKSRTFWGSKITTATPNHTDTYTVHSCSKTHEHKNANVTVFIWRMDLMILIWGKSIIRAPLEVVGPRNGFARIKIVPLRIE